MPARFSLGKDTFTIYDYQRVHPFSSFLPGIAGEFGKPMWLFYTNRGQCVSSFGVRNRNNAMLEFYPANKAYMTTPLLGFRTFFSIGSGPKSTYYEPFRVNAGKDIEQLMRIRAHEVEIEETHRTLGVRVRANVFSVPNESLPMVSRVFEIENIGKRPLSFTVCDGLPQIVPFGLNEFLLKQMSRTMEAFAEVVHGEDLLPFFKLKVEPSDRPEIEWIEGGFFNFSFANGKAQKVLTDPEAIFGHDTSFNEAIAFRAGRSFAWKPRLTSLTASAMTATRLTVERGDRVQISSYYGQADKWETAQAMRKKIAAAPSFAEEKRQESAALLRSLTDSFAVHSGIAGLDPYSRQAFLDNTLRGGKPFVTSDAAHSRSFHYYSRKHGDMERDYNAFEVAPNYYSQGNGNFRDVNQNRRSEVMLCPGVGAGNIETFFNLLQLDGYNPLTIQFERFVLDKATASSFASLAPEEKRSNWTAMLAKPFSPGELFEMLLSFVPTTAKAREAMEVVLLRASKLQDAAHGEGFWIDHWTYNLDLIENFASVFPDQLRDLFIHRKDFTYFDSDHVVQPRQKKYVRRMDGAIRQMGAVIKDAEKTAMIRARKEDPNKVRTLQGKGPIFNTTLLAKVLGLLAIKASTLDAFGIGIEMESDKPGWCDALNGMPGLLGSSVNESFELRRWVSFVQGHLPSLWLPGNSLAMCEELAEFLKAVGEALAIARPNDYYPTWDAVTSLRERFREKTRLGVSGIEKPVSREGIDQFLAAVSKVLDAGLPRAFQRNGLCATYFINEAAGHEALPVASVTEGEEPPLQNVRITAFSQAPVSPFLEGTVHALRVMKDPAHARKLYKAVKASELWDKKLKMFRLNVPLTEESYEIGRNKIFTPGWLENESVFLHMAYKFLFETLRSGLVEEFFEDLKTGLVAFQKAQTYGRSTFENSSFIASSRFPDARVHGAGFVARLTGATAEWISMMLYMGLGRQPFRFEDGQLTFNPEPTLPESFFTKVSQNNFPRDTFGFKLFGKTWIVYQNPRRLDTFGARLLRPGRYTVSYPDGRQTVHSGNALPSPLAQQLREGKLSQVLIELGS